MFNLLYDNLYKDETLLNAYECGGMSKFKNIENHFTSFSIPYKRVDSSKPLQSKKLTLYPVEIQKVFDIMNPSKPEAGFVNFIKPESLNHLKNQNNNCFLLIWFPTEGFCLSLFNNSVPTYISLLINRYKIPKEKILFVYGDINIKKSGVHTQLFNILSKSNVFGLNIFEYISDCDFNPQVPRPADDLLVDKQFSRNKDKLFLLKNGVVRPHRMHLITSLSKLGVLDRGYYSWINHTNERYTQEDYIRTFWPYRGNVKERDCYIKEYKTKILNKTPIVLDKKPEELKDRANQTTLDFKYIRNSYFSIVTETVVDNEEHGILFLSEKTYQPMHLLHPFISYSCQGTLQYLREQGYATFPELFDERYDLIVDEKERAKYIINEVERLAKLSRVKLNNIIYSDYMNDKLKHNRELVKTLPSKSNYYQLINWLESIYLRNNKQ